MEEKESLFLSLLCLFLYLIPPHSLTLLSALWEGRIRTLGTPPHHQHHNHQNHSHDFYHLGEKFKNSFRPNTN